MDDWVKFISIMSSRPRIPIPDPYTTRTTDIPLSTISRIIRQNASRITNKKAIFNQNCTLNYGELWTSITSASQEIYQSLCTCLGEFPTNDMILPIVSRKSLKTIITCLAIINIGISYLPLDQNTPQKRLKTIFERTSTKCYIADKDLSISGSTALIVHFNLPSAAVTSEALRERSDLSSALYTIYTSGTTGEPKGVLIVQQSVVNLAVESTQNFFMKATDCVYQFTNFCFDNSVLEIIMALTNGSALLVKEDPFVPEHFINEIDQYQITHALLFPSLVEVFDDEELQQLKKLRYWIVGAEKLSENILNQSLANGTNVIQNYGPTETTAYALYKYMHILDHPNNLGRPIANVRAFVSDTRNLKNLTPNFAKNQLVLQGINLMRGYILSDSTNKCKLMNMYYCTGDLVYKQPDGNIIFIGRNDQQVKIRGFRIELTEIEAVLLKESSVKQAKVIVKNPEKHLHAFLVSRHPDDILKTNDIKNFCKQYLPYYMIPTCFQQIQTIPINSNSKVDFKKLEDYAKEYKDVQFTEQPQTDTEKTLLQIFHDDLGSPVSLVDDFFLIGGNSLLAQRVIEQIEIEFKVQIPLQAIYRYKTIKGLAELIDNTKQDELHCAVGQPHSTVDGTRYEPGQLLPISFEQQQIYYLNNTEFASYYNLIFSQKFPNTTNLKHLHHSFHRMILKQQSLRTVFKEVNFDAYQFLLSGTEAYFHLWIENDTDMIKISELSKQAFNYSNAPPIMCLLQATTDSFFVVMIVNHIISDAWSTRIIETEMKHFYTNKTEDETWKKKLDYSYVWYSKQQQNSSSLDEIRKKSEFFANYMCEHIADNRTLWSDYPKNELSTSNFQNYQSRIPKEQYQNLLKTCSNYSCSPSVLFLSALTATVHSITSNRTVIVGVVASNRNNQTKNIIGNFLNLLLVPSTFSSKEGHNQISDHLNRIKVSLETSQQYETVPILPLLRKIRYVTKKKFTPEIIFNCRYTIENNSTNEISVPNVQEFDKCMYAIEMDVDLVDGEYCWTIRIHNDTILVQHQTEFRETFSNLLQQLINLFKNEEAKEGKQAANNKLAENTSKNTAMEEVEKKLKTIWKNCLNTEFFTTTSDFFFVGGDSLSCLKLKRHINETFLTDIPIEQLTNNSIFNQMVHTIHYKIMENSCKNAIDQKIPSNVLIELNPRSTATTQSVIFLHPLIGGITLPYIHVVHELIKLDNNLQILGCQHPNTFSNHFNDPHYNSSIEKLCSMYVEKLLPHLNDSKCTLVGASLGGILCYECANQLNTKGIKKVNNFHKLHNRIVIYNEF
uniref:Carrier domain-containing protein n=1 Tax=Syphacia muris TaxID=451379 RepID=A0A0N5AFL3_9BILA